MTTDVLPPLPITADDRAALKALRTTANAAGLDVDGARVRRTSSRFCLGVEHGDYNGTELFGVGTDRFIWLACKPNERGCIRVFSANFPEEGVIEFVPGQTPPPGAAEIADSWARFPFGADHVLRREGYRIERGVDLAVSGNIPGGGMSRSASLSINLVLSLLEVNGIPEPDGFRVVDLAQAIETDYIGSPCGQLDQIMIYFAREGMGTHYNPADRSITYVPLGDAAGDFRIVSLDTGTVRPGLEKSTYRIRREECERLAARVRDSHGVAALGQVRDEAVLQSILDAYRDEEPGPCDRLRYLFDATRRFDRMLEAWKQGNMAVVGELFRADGIGLRDTYRISGPELETMCDIARSVPGVLGERMLGGGDKGAAGALVRADSIDALRAAVDTGYPRSHPELADRYAIHVCNVVDGVRVLDATL